MTEENKDAGYEFEQWTYMGRRPGDNGPSYWWQRPNGEVSSYSQNIVKASYCRVGAVYRVFYRAEEGMVRISGDNAPRFVEVVDGDEVHGWTVKDRAARTADGARKRAAKMARQPDRLEEVLKPISEMYSSLSADQQRALIADVIWQITRPTDRMRQAMRDLKKKEK